MIDSVSLNRALSGSTSLWAICYDIRKFIERLLEVFIVVEWVNTWWRFECDLSIFDVEWDNFLWYVWKEDVRTFNNFLHLLIECSILLEWKSI